MFYFNSAAYDFQKVGYNVALEDSVIARFETVQRLAPDGDYRLKLRVSAELTGCESRVTLNDIKLAPFGVF